MPDVTGREHVRHAGLEPVRRALEGPAPGFRFDEVAAGKDGCTNRSRSLGSRKRVPARLALPIRE
jgi:hypothetical protein